MNTARHRSGSRIAPLLALVLIGSLSSAELRAQPELPAPQVVPLIVPGEYRDHRLPIETASPANRVLSGHLDDGTTLDLLVLGGGMLQGVSSFDVFSTAWLDPAAVTGVVVDRSTTGADALYVADAEGLSRWQLHPNGSATVTAIAAPGWAGAHGLVLGDVGGGPADDLLAISASGDVLILLDPGTAQETTTSFTVWGGAIDLALVDWDGTGALEIATCTSNTLTVWDETGARLIQSHLAAGTGSIARLPRPGLTDAVAWATIGPLGLTSELAVIAEDEPTLVAVTVGHVLRDIAAGDLDGDGWCEVVGRSGTKCDLVLVRGSANGFDTLDPFSFQVLPGVPGELAGGRPEFVDLEGDGDLDLIWAADGGRRLRSIRSSLVDEAKRAPKITTAVQYDPQTGAPSLRFEIENGGLEDPQVTPKMQLALLRVPNGGGPTEVVEAELRDHGPSYLPWVVSIPEASATFTASYTLVARYVETDAAGAVTLSGPATTAWATSEGLLDLGTGGVLDAKIAAEPTTPLIPLPEWDPLLPGVLESNGDSGSVGDGVRPGSNPDSNPNDPVMLDSTTGT